MSTTRHVLLTLSLYMDRDGACWPGVLELADATGLSARAVGKHLRIAEDEDWIKVERGQRANSYQASLPTPEPRSTVEPRSSEPNDHDSGTSEQTTCVNYSRTTQVAEERGSSMEVRDLLPGRDVHAPPARATRSPETGPVPTPEPQQRPARATAGPSLDDVVNALRETYPHPSNRGAARRVPNPQAIEGWLADRIRMGQLNVNAYPLLIDAARREAALAERNPDTFRKTLRTWVRETGWTDTIEDEPGPTLPPASPGPAKTPEGWA